jgi:hypothetical protein
MPDKLPRQVVRAFASLNTMLDAAAAAGFETRRRRAVIAALRTCRKCGCTDARACITGGAPCHWVEADLCSACVPTPRRVRKPSSGHVEIVGDERITHAQMYALKRVRDRGPEAWCVGRRSGGAVAKMFDRMRARGLVTKPPYEITDKGRRVLRVLGQ